MLIAFIIWSLIAIFFVVFGIITRKAEKPMGIWANAEPPKENEITDVKKYNKAVSKLWFVYAFVFEVLAIPFLVGEQNSPLFIFSILGALFLTIGIMVAYLGIEKKYRKLRS